MPPGSQAPIVVLKGIVKRFGAFTALRGVDFDLLGGEVHVLLGENGYVEGFRDVGLYPGPDTLACAMKIAATIPTL